MAWISSTKGTDTNPTELVAVLGVGARQQFRGHPLLGTLHLCSGIQFTRDTILSHFVSSFLPQP
ncbi:MAG: hypothetical protein ACK55Z_09030, partial [bacterium]